MAFLVNLPPLGEGIFEAQVVELHKKVGDVIKEGDVIADMQTDKATGALAAPVGGTIQEFYVELGDYIFRNEKVVLIDDGKAELTTGSGGDAGRVAEDGSIVAPPADEKLAGSEGSKPVASESNQAAPATPPASQDSSQQPQKDPQPEEVKQEKPEQSAQDTPEKSEKDTQIEPSSSSAPLVKSEELSDGVIKMDKLGSAAEIRAWLKGETLLDGPGNKPDPEFMMEQGQAQQGVVKPPITYTKRYKEPLKSNYRHSLDGSKPIPTHLRENRSKEELLDVGKDVAIAPALRHFAAEYGIDITQLPTDENGVVTKEILDTAISHGVKEHEWNYRLIDEMDPGYWSHRADEESGREETYIRKYNASRFEMTHHKVPPFSVSVSIDMTKLNAYLEIIKGENKVGKNPYAAYIIQAICAAAYRYPELNSSIDDVVSVFRFKPYVNVGIEMNTVQGLFTPVVKDANKKSIKELEKNIAELEHEVKVERIFNYETNSEGTITITDLSELGEVESFIPMVHYPEAAIFGYGKPLKKPVVVNDEVVIRPMMPMTIVADHRILTRDKIVRIINFIKDMLEEPSLLFSQEYE